MAPAGKAKAAEGLGDVIKSLGPFSCQDFSLQRRLDADQSPHKCISIDGEVDEYERRDGSHFTVRVTVCTPWIDPLAHAPLHRPAAPEVAIQEVDRQDEWCYGYPANRGWPTAAADPLLGSSASVKETVSEIEGTGVRARFNRVKRRFQGWRAGASICATAVGTVLAINILLIIIASATNAGSSGGLATIQSGDCTESQNLDTWLHLLINVLSTMLLASSNYCMQCLSSSTRKDVDKAHARGKWLDVGIHSIRNLGSIPRFRLLLWSILALSSVPIHLLFNSTLLLTRSSNNYALFAGSPLLLTGDGIDWSKPIGKFFSLGDHTIYDDQDSTAHDPPPVEQFRDIGSWDNLTNEACIKAYSEKYLVGRGDLVMITPDLNASVPMLLAREVTGFDTASTIADDWRCNAYSGLDCTTNDLLADPSAWKLNDSLALSWNVTYSQQYDIQYCLSQSLPERCTVQLSYTLMAAVIACNVVKLLCMLSMLLQRRFRPLVTIGDAIESFMVKKDPTTRHMCLADKSAFTSQDWQHFTKPWLRKRRFWFASASIKRWVLCNLSSILTIVIAGVLLGMGLGEARMSPSTSFSTSGFGTINTDLMANDQSSLSKLSLVGAAVVANSPQLFLSILFLGFNSLYTCMLLADEWNGYASKRKPLRVSQPSWKQRSTYFLQLPYRYGVPLMIISILLHWLLSESLFLARVTVYNRAGEENTDNSISTIGYSLIPLVVVIAVGCTTVLAAVLNGFRRYKPGIPLAGSCSAAISAACHPPENDIHGSEKPVMWGVVGTNKYGNGHCSFTSLNVSFPKQGESYTGLRRWSRPHTRVL